MNRLLLALFFCLSGLAASAQGAFTPVTPGRAFKFPADLGSHPTFRTEWWYVTGWLTTDDGEELGFQVTFFRSKPDITAGNPSNFSPHQIIIAHCALSDPKRGRLWQDQRIRRVGFGLAGADEGNTRAWVEGWSLNRQDGVYIAKIAAENFAFDLTLTDTQPPLLNGEGGFSRKGPGDGAASYYYSLPHLRVTGSVTRQNATVRVTGAAWFDHEWSSQYLDAQAAGWDWIGINLQDGAALMAFQIRGLDGKARWAGGSLRSANGATQILRADDVEFRPLRHWSSPNSGVSYPVEWAVRAGSREFKLSPLFDDQENDTRLSTGAIYWEGAVRAFEGNAAAGRGYLELTGYGERLQLR